MTGKLASLTAREREVLVSLIDGAANKDIAKRLGISARTVQKHLQRTYAKLGVKGRTAAALVAFRFLASATERPLHKGELRRCAQMAETRGVRYLAHTFRGIVSRHAGGVPLPSYPQTREHPAPEPGVLDVAERVPDEQVRDLPKNC